MVVNYCLNGQPTSGSEPRAALSAYSKEQVKHLRTCFRNMLPCTWQKYKTEVSR